MLEPVSFELISLIKRLSALVQQHIDSKLKPYGLARTQYVAMYYLASRSGLSSNELAELMLVEPATLCGIADTLQAKGLIDRVESTTDKRRKNLVLTDKGRKLYATIPPPAPDIEQMMLQGVLWQDAETMKQVGKQMIENLTKELKLQEGEKHAAKTKAKVA